MVSTSDSAGPVDSPDLEAQLPRVLGFGTSRASTAGTTTADGSRGSGLPLISLDQPKQGGSAQALHLYGAQLIQHDIPLQEDLVFASRPPPQQSLSLLGPGPAVAAAAAAVVALSHPMSISAAVGLKDMSSRAAPAAQHKSRLDRARQAIDTTHALAKKRTTLRAAAAMFAMITQGCGLVRGATLPTALPSSTTSIDYDSQGYLESAYGQPDAKHRNSRGVMDPRGDQSPGFSLSVRKLQANSRFGMYIVGSKLILCFGCFLYPTTRFQTFIYSYKKNIYICVRVLSCIYWFRSTLSLADIDGLLDFTSTTQ